VEKYKEEEDKALEKHFAVARIQIDELCLQRRVLYQLGHAVLK